MAAQSRVSADCGSASFSSFGIAVLPYLDQYVRSWTTTIADGILQPMLGDHRRSAQAEIILQIREARFLSFQADLFGEHAWLMLLHLFIAMARNEPITRAELFSRLKTTDRIGGAWLRHLVASQLVSIQSEDSGVELTSDAVHRLRTFLDAASSMQPRNVNY